MPRPMLSKETASSSNRHNHRKTKYRFVESQTNFLGEDSKASASEQDECLTLTRILAAPQSGLGAWPKRELNIEVTTMRPTGVSLEPRVQKFCEAIEANPAIFAPTTFHSALRIWRHGLVDEEPCSFKREQTEWQETQCQRIRDVIRRSVGIQGMSASMVEVMTDEEAETVREGYLNTSNADDICIQTYKLTLREDHLGGRAERYGPYNFQN